MIGLPARTLIQDTGETLFMLRASVADQAALEEVTADAVTAPGTLISRSKKAFVVATANGAVSIREVQLKRGKGRPMPVAAALNGYGDLFEIGQRFTSAPQ